MRNLEAVQQGLVIVRNALTPLVERVLRAEYGDDWWQRGVLDALIQDQKPVHDRPPQGNAGDIDLQLALKLVQVYHWELFSDDLGWGGRQRSLLGAVTAVRNQYEGHVTPNREAELNDGKTRDLLEGMEMFVHLFDHRAGDQIGNLIELLKMQQPEPEPPAVEETVILRRPLPSQTAQRPQRSAPERMIRPIAARPEPTLKNGAGGRSMPVQAQPLWKRQQQVRWGAAVRTDPPAEEAAPPQAPEAARRPDTPATSARATAMGEVREGDPLKLVRTATIESPVAARRLTPEPVEDTVKVLPPRPPKARSTPRPEKKKRRPAAEEALPPDPEPFLKRYRSPGGKSAPSQRPDPDLYIPARVRERTPKRLRREPYEVDVHTGENRRGEPVLQVDPPPRPAPVRDHPVTRPPLRLVLRVGAMVLLGVVLGVGLIFLDGWLSTLLGR